MTALSNQGAIDTNAWRSIAHRAVAEPLPKGLDALWSSGAGVLARLRSRPGRSLREAEIVRRIIGERAGLGTRAFGGAIAELRGVFALQREKAGDVRAGIALASIAAQRTLGLTAHAEQIAAALAIDGGACVEMATGEGKTLAGALAAALSGWRGRGCHVITANDYLAGRDALALAPLHGLLGLTCASVGAGSGSVDRRRAYACDITYCTSKEAAADALRDRIVSRRWGTLGEALLERALGVAEAPIGDRLITRGQACAIVDEADSVLIDEAVTPLILSAPAHNPDQERILREAAGLASVLVAGADYVIDRRFSDLRITPRGLARIDDGAARLHGVWGGVRRRRELVETALRVREFFREGEQYVVHKGKVVIVDESTGRLMPDRSWRQGLHQAIEACEGLEPTPIKDTLARISFQRYFRGYRRLSGMTGTAREVTRELWSVYGLPVVSIPRHEACRRVDRAPVMLATTGARWDAIIAAVVDRHARGQPVLIGTRTVEASERCGRLLDGAGVGRRILNAVHEGREAEIIARAGEVGAVTVATNMAGRGTDIVLGEGAAALGGLCVIVSEPHQSARLDRQLMGRSGRQGDPGESLRFASPGDDLLVRQASRAALSIVRALPAPGLAGRLVSRLAQRRAMLRARSQRLAVIRQDEWLDESLGFAGPE
jgi:preprotein translocase subunit SecA